MELHLLLKRELERHFGPLESVPEQLRPLVDAINDAFFAADAERAVLERSLQLSSRELVQANAEMRAVLHAFPDVFVWLEGDGTIHAIQGSQRDPLFGPAVRGQRIGDLPNAEVSRKFKGAIRLVHDSERVVPIEYEIEVDGELQYYEARLLPLMQTQFLAIIRNITDRKRTQEALAAEKERLTVTLRSIGDAVITTDMQCRVRLMNKIAEKLTGYTQAEAQGQPIAEILVLGRDRGEHEIENPAHRVIRDGGSAMFTITARLCAREGGQRLVDTSAAVIRDSESKIVGVVVVARDITERRKLEEEQLRASKLESVGILAGGIAHDFNNILTSILGSISLSRLHIDSRPQRAAQLLASAERASIRARDLTQQLLTFSRGGVPIKEAAAAGELIRDSASFALRGSNVSCRFQIAPSLPSIDVDPGQMSQVINNLIINADQAMPEGGEVVIGCETVADPQAAELPYSPTGWVRIFVRDQGVGIPRDYLSKIFDPYFTTKQRGSGLGLATCYSIVKNHDGVIAVDSELGAGTCVSVYIPASTNGIAHQPARSQTVTGGQGRILVMDDEQHVLEVCGNMLEFLGYSVAYARDGAEAIEIYTREQDNGAPFDAVIADLTVPGGMGGKEAVARLKAIDPELKAIASSGYSNDPVLASFGEFGFRGILTKPYNIQELDKTLQECCWRDR